MSDQISDRKAKLEKIRALDVDPYGGRFAGVTKNADIRAAAEKMDISDGQVLEGDEATFRAAGRIILCRDMGSLIFLT
ncbi:MAG: lysine--tRNA ligase, partial [Planctomycetes bacterium]|nr:lysine--tRNA ligase [Planctomycetota bacterium]